MSPTRFSVIVPIYNELPLLQRCIASMSAAVTAYGDAELILVDNGSSDGSYDFVRDRYGAIARILRIPDVSIGAVRNHGAAAATGTHLAFVDADCTIPVDYLSRAAAVFDRAEVAATGSRHRIDEAASLIDRTWHALHRVDRRGPVRYLPSGNLCVRRSTFEEVGGFDEELTTGEDAELCQRIRQAGGIVYEAPEVSATHLGTPGDLKTFFGKEVWHGLGMFGTVGWREIDRPTAMLFLYLLGLCIALAASIGSAFGYVSGWVAGAVVIVALFAVPSASVLYRFARVRRIRRPFLATGLYTVYYLARSVALWRILRGKTRGAAAQGGP